MARQMMAIVVVLCLGVLGCERKGEEKTVSPPAGESMSESPATQPGATITEPPRTPEPADQQSERQSREGMTTEQGQSGTEEMGQSGATTAPAGEQSSAEESTPVSPEGDTSANR